VDQAEHHHREPETLRQIYELLQRRLRESYGRHLPLIYGWNDDPNSGASFSFSPFCIEISEHIESLSQTVKPHRHTILSSIAKGGQSDLIAGGMGHFG
jgi:hypothetical protein